MNNKLLAFKVARRDPNRVVIEGRYDTQQQRWIGEHTSQAYQTAYSTSTVFYCGPRNTNDGTQPDTIYQEDRIA